MTIDLAELQGNIARGYKDFLHLEQLFATVGSDPARFKDFLADLSQRVTAGNVANVDVAVNVGISYSGLAKLIPNAAPDLTVRFPSYAAGMYRRADALGDPEHARYDDWARRELWITVHATDKHHLAQHVAALMAEAHRHGVNLIKLAPSGSVIRDESGGRLEHFGFKDGISNPVFAGVPGKKVHDGNGKRDPKTNEWTAIATGEFLLGHPNEQGFDALHEMSDDLREIFQNGTFAVLRDLEQHVKRFREYVEAQQQKNHDGHDGTFFAEKMVGRTMDGRALAATDEKNDFDYSSDPQGAKCPMGAHVRRANPRVDGEHRLLRRSVPYGDFVKPGSPVSDEKRGVYFIAMNASIENQFEFLQRNYLNGEASSKLGFGKLSRARDPLAASGPCERRMAIEGDCATARQPVLLLDIPAFVTCHGGEYYFMPSIAGLRALGRRNGTEWVVPQVFQTRRQPSGVRP